MADTRQKRPRASNGRFVKKTRAGSKKPARAGQSSTPGSASHDASGVVRHRPGAEREGSVRLALLTLAILFAAIGFALPFLWIGSIVLMGVLWGAMIAERPQRRATVTGLVTEMVTAVVDEAKDAVDPNVAPHSDVVSRSSADDEGRPGAG
jgi:hypothetical protein